MRLAVFVLLLFVIGCDHIINDIVQPGSNYDPNLVFRHLINKSIPDTVSEIQGDMLTLQGYGIYLRFKADTAFIDNLINSKYKKVQWEQIKYNFNQPGGYSQKVSDIFHPPWEPQNVTTKECYELENIKNDWTHSGTNYLLIDRLNGIVYFVGFGA
jgi:predicted transport protein